MIIRNKSGGVASLYGIGAIDIADDGEFDASTVTDGQPAVLPTKLQGSPELLEALDDGSWCVVMGGVELGAAQSVAAVTPSTDEALDAATGYSFANPWQVMSPNPGSRVWADLPGCSWTVTDDEALSGVVNVGVVVNKVPGGGVISFTLSKSGVDTAVLDEESDRFGRFSGYDVRAERFGSTVKAQIKRNGTDPIRVTTWGTARLGDIS